MVFYITAIEFVRRIKWLSTFFRNYKLIFPLVEWVTIKNENQTKEFFEELTINNIQFSICNNQGALSNDDSIEYISINNGEKKWIRFMNEISHEYEQGSVHLSMLRAKIYPIDDIYDINSFIRIDFRMIQNEIYKNVLVTKYSNINELFDANHLPFFKISGDSKNVLGIYSDPLEVLTRIKNLVSMFQNYALSFSNIRFSENELSKIIVHDPLDDKKTKRKKIFSVCNLFNFPHQYIFRRHKLFINFHLIQNGKIDFDKQIYYDAPKSLHINVDKKIYGVRDVSDEFFSDGYLIQDFQMDILKTIYPATSVKIFKNVFDHKRKNDCSNCSQQIAKKIRFE